MLARLYTTRRVTWRGTLKLWLTWRDTYLLTYVLTYLLTSGAISNYLERTLTLFSYEDFLVEERVNSADRHFPEKNTAYIMSTKTNPAFQPQI